MFGTYCAAGTLSAFNTRRPEADNTHAQLRASLEEVAQPRPLPLLLSPYRYFRPPRPTVTVEVRPERLAHCIREWALQRYFVSWESTDQPSSGGQEAGDSRTVTFPADGFDLTSKGGF